MRKQVEFKDPPYGLAPLCITCKHDTSEKGKPKCKAFPEGIPDAIWYGEHDHHYPYPGDGGIRYVQASAMPKHGL